MVAMTATIVATRTMPLDQKRSVTQRPEELHRERVARERQEDDRGGAKALPDVGKTRADRAPVWDGDHGDADSGKHDGQGQHLLTRQQFRGGRGAEPRPDEPARAVLADEDLVEGEEREWWEDRKRHVDLSWRPRDHPRAKCVYQAG